MTNTALFEPFRLAGCVLPNRIVMAPMTRTFSPGGVPGPDVAAYYRRRAEGGVGLIVTEGTWIDHPAASNDDRAARFYGEDALRGWRRVVEEVHAAGGRIMPQLWHTGLIRRRVSAHLYDAIDEDLTAKVSPSGYVMPGERIGRGMTEAEIDAVITAYAEGAAVAERLGFDGIEIHGAHGYLVDQFLWDQTNSRDERYGGDLGRRTTFAVEMIRACRARVSVGFPIVLRFSQWKLQDYQAKLARTPQELEAILGPLADAGVDAFHASQRRHWLAEFEGSQLNLAGWAKKLTGKPSITVGSVGLSNDMGEFMRGETAAAASVDVAARPRPLEMELREQIDMLRMMDDDYGVFGQSDGRGVAIRSEEPVDFHPLRKTSNVVCVPDLMEAVVNVATQSVGVYPFGRMSALRDHLASGGAQRIVRLGGAGPSSIGNPHDAMYPLHRFVHWMANEDGADGAMPNEGI